MDYNERFGQIELLLADLLRRMDRQAEQMDRQAEQMDNVINILKISDERQSRAEERQDAMLAEMQRGFAKADRKFGEQNQQIKEQNQRLIDQGKRQDVMLNTQLQMLEVLSRQATRTDELEQRVPTVLAFEGRMRRLEEAVFNKAS